MDKFVHVKEVKSGLTKGQKVYPLVVDQDNENWYLFNLDTNTVKQNCSYLFSYELNDKGFKDITKITPLVNVFHQRALREVASRNDYVRNLITCLSYSKDMVNAGTLEMPQLFDKATEMYQWVNSEADRLMPKEETK